MLYRQLGIWLLLLLAMGHHVYGQAYHASTRRIGLSDGLSHYRVLSLLPDQDGMWIGTQDGLNFFDGYSWQYWSKDEGHFSDAHVNFLSKDQEGLLWIFHTKDVFDKHSLLSIDILDPFSDSIYSARQKPGTPLPFQIEDVQQFFADSFQKLYFLTQDALWAYSLKNQFRKIPLPTGFFPQHCLSDGTLVGVYQGRLSLASQEGELLASLNMKLKENRYFELLGERDQFWVWQIYGPCKVFHQLDDPNSYNDELFRLQQFRQSNFSLLHFNSQKGEMWVSKGDSAYLMDRSGKTLFQTFATPRRIAMDANGNYWIGKYELQVLRLQNRKFSQYLKDPQTATPEKDAFQCRGIYQKEKKLYVGTYWGVQEVDLATREFRKLPLGMKPFFTFLEDKKEQFWLGYNDLIQLGPDRERIVNRYSFENKNPRIWSLYEDKNEMIWLGHQLGLSILKDDKIQDFSQYNGFDELQEALVLFFYEDRDGVIWVGSNEGLYQLVLGQGIVGAYGSNRVGKAYLPSKKFHHMHLDEEGKYWLATEDAGLLCWDKSKGTWEKYDKDWGMLTNNIYSVYEDDYGYLWMSSFNGMIRFHKKTETVQFFHKEDGISHDEFNRISHHKGENGQLYFGSQDGVTALNPSDFKDEYFQNQGLTLSIKHISIIGKRIQTDFWDDGKPIDLWSLPPKTRIIDLHIKCSNSFWAGNVSLNYTLERLQDSDSIISRESVSFGDHIELFEMPPGQYKLKVRAVQKNGKQLGNDLDIPIRILKPMHQRPWFWLIWGGVAVLAFICLSKWRTHRLTKQKEALENLVEERTKEVLENQETINQQAQIIEKMKDQLDQREEQWLSQFRSIIEDRLEDPNLYLPDIIDEMNIGRTAFYEKVKQLTQMTPNQYIQELRLQRAKTILQEGKASTVKEVSSRIGMKEPKYFSKLFKERFGILPSSYFRDNRR